VQLGGDVSLTAGPKNLHEGAYTDGTFKAEVSYSPPPRKR
jgi:hypothetical protein